MLHTEFELGVKAPTINIDNGSTEDIKLPEIDPVSINRELYLRLVKTGVIDEYDNKDSKSLAEIQASKETLWELTSMQSISYLNGQLFGRYIVFLKKHMKRCWNQIWSIKVSVIKELKFGISEECRGDNWYTINAELDVRKLFPPHPVCYSFVSVFRKSRSPSTTRVY